jgi:ABC-type uncharacterized transport system permease subunit
MKIDHDRMSHLLMGAFASAIALLISFDPWLGILTAFLACVLKWIRAFFHPEIHRLDIRNLIATTLGGVAWTTIFLILLI